MSTFERLEALFVGPSTALREAMAVFNQHAARCDGSGITLVVGPDHRLLGVLTDGDARRALLAGLSLDDPVERAMTRSPIVAAADASPHQLLRLFDRRLRHLPLVDHDGRVVDLLLYSRFTVAPPGRTVIVRAKAPLRISFAGGGTDFTHHFTRRPSAVLSATINQYCHGTLAKRDDGCIRIRSEDYGVTVEAESLSALEYDGRLDLLKAVIRLCRPAFGLELTTWSDAPPGSGLGSSAAMAVVTIGLLNELAGDQRNEYQVADLAYQAERVELGIPGGWQDQYASAFGGFNFIEFNEREVLVHPLALRERVTNELEEGLILCFSGQTRNSGEAHTARAALAPDDAVELGRQSFELAIEVKNALVQGRVHEFGPLLERAWLWKKAIGAVTNERIEELHRAALAAGALGGKLLGAGQSGFMLFYCPPLKRRRVAAALAELDATSLNISFDARGLRVWRLVDHQEQETGLLDPRSPSGWPSSVQTRAQD